MSGLRRNSADHRTKEVARGETVVASRIEADTLLKPFERKPLHRIQMVNETEHRITGGRMSLAEFANGHEYFGMHYRAVNWVFREWAPNAAAICIKGPFSDWKAQDRFTLSRNGQSGVWEIDLPADALHHESP